MLKCQQYREQLRMAENIISEHAIKLEDLTKAHEIEKQKLKIGYRTKRAKIVEDFKMEIKVKD